MYLHPYQASPLSAAAVLTVPPPPPSPGRQVLSKKRDPVTQVCFIDEVRSAHLMPLFWQDVTGMIRTEFVRAAEGNRAAFTALLAVLPTPLCGLCVGEGRGCSMPFSSLRDRIRAECLRLGSRRACFKFGSGLLSLG